MNVNFPPHPTTPQLRKISTTTRTVSDPAAKTCRWNGCPSVHPFSKVRLFKLNRTLSQRWAFSCWIAPFLKGPAIGGIPLQHGPGHCRCSSGCAWKSPPLGRSWSSGSGPPAGCPHWHPPGHPHPAFGSAMPWTWPPPWLWQWSTLSACHTMAAPSWWPSPPPAADCDLAACIQQPEYGFMVCWRNFIIDWPHHGWLITLLQRLPCWWCCSPITLFQRWLLLLLLFDWLQGMVIQPLLPGSFCFWCHLFLPPHRWPVPWAGWLAGWWASLPPHRWQLWPLVTSLLLLPPVPQPSHQPSSLQSLSQE